MKVGILYNLVEDLESDSETKISVNEILVTAKEIQKILSKNGHQVEAIKVNRKNMKKLKGKYNIIFNLAEGIGGYTYGEIEIAQCLEEQEIKFTGAGKDGLAICLNKAAAKKKMLENGILTPKFQIFANPNEILNPDLRFPLIIKPSNEDGSIGISLNSVVNNVTELKEKVNEIIKKYKQDVLVEEYIDGREIECPLIGNEKEIRALPMLETMYKYPIGTPKILTFESKWIENSELYKKSVTKCPIKITDSLKNKIEKISKKCFKIMNCHDYARIDFRVKDDIPYVLEVNPNPCINPTDSGLGWAAEKEGIKYPQLIMELFNHALKRYNIK